MHRPDPERLELFWTSVQDVFLKLYGSRLATSKCSLPNFNLLLSVSLSQLLLLMVIAPLVD